ncbi:MAG: acyltransferase [Bacteroidales bacterium]|nr:acyltransferase [Bacteroidales bacterium]MBR4624820.1 acyltransferase [Alphaproteobacteria bacterium]
MSSTRVSYFDALNVFSCFSVIALHCNGIFHQYTQTAAWNFSAVIQVLFYCAVPVFFMLSGATLLRYNERYSTTDFYKKRLKKTLIPYLFFSVLFYALHCIIVHYVKPTDGEESLTLLQILVSGKAPFSNFWFFIPLFMLYLFMPALSKIALLPQKTMLFLCGAMIFFQGAYPVIAFFFDLKSITAPIGGYALYMFLGLLLHENDFEKDNKIYFSVVSLALIAFATRLYLLFENADHRIDLLMTYHGLYAILPSMAIFMTFKRFLNKHNDTIKLLSGLSFGVFLIQQFVIQCCFSIAKKITPNYEILMQTIGIIFVYLICCLIVFIVRKIKILQWMFP